MPERVTTRWIRPIEKEQIRKQQGAKRKKDDNSQVTDTAGHKAKDDNRTRRDEFTNDRPRSQKKAKNARKEQANTSGKRENILTQPADEETDK